MCGIAGKVSFSDVPVASEDIRRMTNAIAHRGPDDAGVYLSRDRRVGLGHRRLSIIDLSSRGHQPMRYLDRYEIVFNGEIYNYQSQREQLEKDGYRFASRTDTEVVLALYDRYGMECLQHLRGMFAFAIYDEHAKTLFCARDRIGKKPFKYYKDDNVFLFGSELKAILTQSEYRPKRDDEAIFHYLTYQYVPAPLTGFQGICKLEPAHYLLLDTTTGKMETQRYWQLDYSRKLAISEEEWKERIINKLDESVKLRMISDVPVGAFLSGGVDSSAIVALMSRHSAIPIKTFSIGFQEEKFNELAYARMVAEKFKTEHTEFIVKQDVMEVLPDLVRQYEEPYADSSALPTYYLSKLTREHVTVALNGDGGDENFAGYPWYGVIRENRRYANYIPRALRMLNAKVLERLYRVRPTHFLRYGRIFAEGALLPPWHLHTELLSYFTAEEKRHLSPFLFQKYASAHSSERFLEHHYNAQKGLGVIDAALHADIGTYLADDLVVKVDIASMAVGLEARSPFLDHEFMELAASVPEGFKLRGREGKYILKKSLEELLPHDLLYRKKQGFSVPINTWFQSGLYEYARDILMDRNSLCAEILERSSVNSLLQHHRLHGDSGRKIWLLLTLELWNQSFF